MTYCSVLPRRLFAVPAEERECTMTPPVNIIEREDAFVLTFDLPGVNKESIKATVDENILTISGEREAESRSDEKYFSYCERPSGKFFRTFRLHSDVDGNAVKGTYENGVLTLELPKKEESRPHVVEIKGKN